MLLYLAGPIWCCKGDEACGWRDRFKKELPQYEFIDPTEKYYRKGSDLWTHNEIISWDKLGIRKAEGIVANCWKPSIGTSMEIIYAWESLRKVFSIFPFEEPSPWIEYHSHKIFKSVDECIEFLRSQN